MAPETAKLIFIATFCGSFALIGAIFVVVGLLLCRGVRKKHERCLAVTRGEIVDLVSDDEGVMFPVVKYTVGSLEYKKRASVGSTNPKVAIGEEIEVYYDQADPHSFYCPRFDKTSRIVCRVFTGLGILFILIAIAGFFIINSADLTSMDIRVNGQRING